MRTMAGVLFIVLVVISANEVFGNVCSKETNKMTCNECIRCAGEWCNKPGSEHCVLNANDDWCTETQSKEIKKTIDEINSPGSDVSLQYAARTLYVGIPDLLPIHYNTTNKQFKPIISILNSTQTLNVEVKEKETKCKDAKCTTTIQATAQRDFCSASGMVMEFVHVQVHVGSLNETVLVKYHVQCACECSQKVERNSPICNKRGDFSCGVCECDAKWTGEFCEKMNCPNNRGDDQQCKDNGRMEKECYGNGYCNECDTCTCYTDRDGSQYFDEENYCADLCVLTADCDYCLRNNTLGYCHSCYYTLQKIAYNETISNERDESNRKVWMKCNLTIDGCAVDYLAMKDEEEFTSVMIMNHCDNLGIVGGQVAGGKTVPIVMGVLVLILAVAAVAGVMIWKHLNAVPAVPLKGPQYQDISAEDCAGENPLYKPPTSSFKNPTYGKW